MTELPAEFVKTILDIHGDEGAAWLDSFPQRLATIAARYDLTLGAPFALSYNYVCAATRRAGTPVVLKLSPPNDEFQSEMDALRHYGVEGCVELLEADAAAGIMLMERVLPGTPLHELPDDEEATRIAAEVMRKLWRPLPPDHNFPTVAKWAKGLQRLRADNHGGTGPLPAHLVERAEESYRDLLASAPSPVLLHGDLHHGNILAATRAPYLAIDPKGVAGEPAYEVGPLLLNPWPGLSQVPNLAQVQARRLAILAERLQLDRERLRACAFAHAVLSAAWSVEDHGDGWQHAIAIAEILLQL
jgi:streptomycin 6-kinase